MRSLLSLGRANNKDSLLSPPSFGIRKNREKSRYSFRRLALTWLGYRKSDRVYIFRRIQQRCSHCSARRLQLIFLLVRNDSMLKRVSNSSDGSSYFYRNLQATSLIPSARHAQIKAMDHPIRGYPALLILGSLRKLSGASCFARARIVRPDCISFVDLANFILSNFCRR